jgi:hypothetical protein
VTSPPTRAAIGGWFADVLDGRRTRDEANEWAIDQIEAGQWEEELVLQGLLRLNGLPALSDAEARASLERWTAELAEYDEDPLEWDRRYFLQLVRGFAARVGVGSARLFAAKLVSDGLLTSFDVREVLGDD